MDNATMESALLIDCGSTSLKWATWSGGHISLTGHCRHARNPAGFVDTIVVDRRVSRILLASVLAENSTDLLCQRLRDRFGFDPEIARSTPVCRGVRNGYIDPERLGIDRWLAMVAAHSRRRMAQLVVDCGTAVTLDVLDGEGMHLGGRIMPGINSMHRALLNTTEIADAPLGAPGAPLGRDTESCVANGIYHAVAAAIENAARELPGPAQQGPVIVLTGGDAADIELLLDIPSLLCPDLVLEGLALWASLEVGQ